MNVEELLRNSLHSEADAVAPIDDLLGASLTKGRRKQRVRRTAAVVGTVGAMGVVAAGAVIVADLGPSNSQSVTPSSGGDSTNSEPVSPWWQTWTTDRHNGPVDQAFLDNAPPNYGDGTQPESIKIWAAGTAPDGTDWVMFTSPSTDHKIQWLQGWDGSPNYGEGAGAEQPGLTWDSFTTPTRAAHDDYRNHEMWLIVVGQPGTTDIFYAADGTHFNTPLEMHDGIGVLKLEGFEPAEAKVQLSDASGVYATGTPQGAGAMAGDDPNSTPTATANPTATPSETTAAASPATEPPAGAGYVLPASPTPTK